MVHFRCSAPKINHRITFGRLCILFSVKCGAKLTFYRKIGTRSFGSVLEVDHPKKVQYDKDDSDNEQRMNPTACFRKPWADIATQKAEQPQYYQNDDDRPQHEISPYRWLI